MLTKPGEVFFRGLDHRKEGPNVVINLLPETRTVSMHNQNMMSDRFNKYIGIFFWKQAYAGYNPGLGLEKSYFLYLSMPGTATADSPMAPPPTMAPMYMVRMALNSFRREGRLWSITELDIGQRVQQELVFYPVDRLDYSIVIFGQLLPCSKVN